MRKIIYTRPDGSVSVAHPMRNTIGETLTTDAEIEQRAWDRLPTTAINPQFVDETVVPTDRTFRNAWRQIGATVAVDMPGARAIWRDKLRELRTPKLAALDTAYMRADEVDDLAEKARIAAEKQVLRDVTADPLIDAAQTPDELKVAMPDVLKART